VNFYPLSAIKPDEPIAIFFTFIAAKLTGALLACFWIAEIYLPPSDRKKN
jgi:hypothetical protein